MNKVNCNICGKFIGYSENKIKVMCPVCGEAIINTSNNLTAIAFVDGSFNPATNAYGFGGFVDYSNGEHVTLQGSDNNPEKAEMRNVSGEIAGAIAAVEDAIEHNASSIEIIYDYMGIEQWATGKWKCNKLGTKEYACKMREFMDVIEIKFTKVKGHTGVDGNEEADRLAKQAVGI